ncbi:MAG: hypothetical protein D6729_19710 [Deltaproteobacteria bacterium]|nr:MAG: hypothetical protein D6729_19710 [Deltaproteobacteria bacterium]
MPSPTIALALPLLSPPARARRLAPGLLCALLLAGAPACTRAEPGARGAGSTAAAGAGAPAGGQRAAHAQGAPAEAAKPGAGAEAASPWAEHIEVRVEAPAGGSPTLVLAARPGWFVNTAYPGLKVVLQGAGGAGAAELTRGAVHFEGTHEGEKAERARWQVPAGAIPAAGGRLTGRYKTVICNPSTCSPPFEGHFEVPVATTAE